MNDLLKGAYDLHVHTAPDVTPRKCTDLELAKRYEASGMKGFTIKCHYADTTGRAAAVKELYPHLDIQSGLVLNHQAGGLNPDAAERMAQMGGRFLWFPTLDSREYQKARHGGRSDFDGSPYLSVYAADGTLLPKAYEVLEVAAQYQLIVGTGHIGAVEGIPLVEAAAKCGVKKIVLTHADNPSTAFTPEQQRYCVKLGAVVEHSYFTTFYGRTSWEMLIYQIEAVGSENVLLTTDFGQMESPYSDEGMLLYVQELMKRGVSVKDIEGMIKDVPCRLING